MSNSEITTHHITKLEITENKFIDFSTINVTATDKQGDEVTFKMFVQGTDKLEYINKVEVE
jgi:hypothetical protein|tara:strand:+ start:992 stop:1174 length:183 start_codon:yes stop_codon:yes gene_type:complete